MGSDGVEAGEGAEEGASGMGLGMGMGMGMGTRRAASRGRFVCIWSCTQRFASSDAGSSRSWPSTSLAEGSTRSRR